MSQTFDKSDPFFRLSQEDQAKLRLAWAEGPAVWRFVSGRGSVKHMRRWLGKQGPADWHDIAMNFDTGGKDLSPLHFIASQPNADRASIMSMVLDAEPLSVEAELARTSLRHLQRSRPEMTKLFDLIVHGFEMGFYKTDRFKLRQDQSVLTRTRSELATSDRPPHWTLPDKAWGIVQSRPHTPDYVWDRVNCCQRLPFHIWVQTKLRPN